MAYLYLVSAHDSYKLLGYTVAYEYKVYPHGIVKYIMVNNDQNAT